MTPDRPCRFWCAEPNLKQNQGPKVLDSSLARGPLQCQSEHYNRIELQHEATKLNQQQQEQNLKTEAGLPSNVETNVTEHSALRGDSDPQPEAGRSRRWAPLSAPVHDYVLVHRH
jgi:hypothetical protein